LTDLLTEHSGGAVHALGHETLAESLIESISHIRGESSADVGTGGARDTINTDLLTDFSISRWVDGTIHSSITGDVSCHSECIASGASRAVFAKRLLYDILVGSR